MIEALDFSVILDWQQRGMDARKAGFTVCNNPIAQIVDLDPRKSTWVHNARAWAFGWSIENAFQLCPKGHQNDAETISLSCV